jgi:hypothetical protein
MSKNLTFMILFMVLPLGVMHLAQVSDLRSQVAALKQDSRVHFKICPRCAGQWEEDINDYCN